MKKQKIYAGIGALVMMASACAVSASAAELTAYLTPKDQVAYSAQVSSLGGGTLWGHNDATSHGNVYVIAKHQYAGIWLEDCSLNLAPGAISQALPRRYATKHTWQLGMNPKGAGSYGCIAEGQLIVE